jgi:hypothetical protein
MIIAVYNYCLHSMFDCIFFAIFYDKRVQIAIKFSIFTLVVTIEVISVTIFSVIFACLVQICSMNNTFWCYMSISWQIILPYYNFYKSYISTRNTIISVLYMRISENNPSSTTLGTERLKPKQILDEHISILFISFEYTYTIISFR